MRIERVSDRASEADRAFNSSRLNFRQSGSWSSGRTCAGVRNFVGPQDGHRKATSARAAIMGHGVEADFGDELIGAPSER